MATLIPAIGACTSRMTAGERRLAERLEQKYSHPDFVVIHPRRGLLVLVIKDWRLATIQRADKEMWEIIPDGIPKSDINPLEQARQYAHQVVNALERDKQLVQNEGKHLGKLSFPWSYGVVFSNITRKQFKDAELDKAIYKVVFGACFHIPCGVSCHCRSWTVCVGSYSQRYVYRLRVHCLMTAMMKLSCQA